MPENFSSPDEALLMGFFAGELSKRNRVMPVTNRDGYTKTLKVTFEGPGGQLFEATINVEKIGMVSF